MHERRIRKTVLIVVVHLVFFLNVCNKDFLCAWFCCCCLFCFVLFVCFCVFEFDFVCCFYLVLCQFYVSKKQRLAYN